MPDSITKTLAGNLFFANGYLNLFMARHLKNIGKQLTIFALIAGIFNIYALEIWCGLTMGHHTQGPAMENVGAIDHAAGAMENCPHQGKGKPSSCEDHHNFFQITVAGSGFQKFLPASGDINFIFPDHFAFAVPAPINQPARPVNLSPDVRLKPKVPDIRIFICSLTI